MATAKSRPATPPAPAASRPATSPKPAASSKPATSPKPAASAKPAAPAKPVASAAPAKPAASTKPAAPAKPAASSKPAAPAKPAASSKVAASPKPAATPPAPAAPGAASSGPAPGQPAPPFALASDAGETVSLRDFNGKSLVLYFYPKDDTPGCTREACAFQASLAALGAKGAAVVGVSRDAPARHVRFKAKYGLTFPLLSDPEGEAHRAYGAWGVKKLYGRESIGPLRTTVVIDRAGKVARVFANVRVDGHAEQVLEALAQLG